MSLLDIPSFQRVAPRRPLIFVPGISDSALAKKIESDTNEEQWQYFWPPPAPPSNLPPEVKKRILDGLHSHIRSDPDDETSVKAMGLWPSTCDYLINALELSGYTLNVNFWIFPYDWRQSNRISGKLLADFIEDKVGKANSAQHEYDDDGVERKIHMSAFFFGVLIYKTNFITVPAYLGFSGICSMPRALS